MRQAAEIIRYQRLCKAMGVEYNVNVNETEEKLRLPEMENRETQTLSVWQDLENANKLLEQEKEACEVDNKNLKQEIAILTEQKCEVEERQREALRDNEALRREVQELQTLLRREIEKQQSDTNELEEEEEEEAVLGVRGPLVEQLEEEVHFLRQRVRVLEERLQSEEGPSCSSEDLGNEPRLSLWQRVVRLLIRRRRRPDSSRGPGEQAREETQRRPTLWERLVNGFNRRFRRTST